MKQDIDESCCLTSPLGTVEVIYSNAIVEFDHLWETGQSRTSKSRMDELMVIIRQYEVEGIVL